MSTPQPGERLPAVVAFSGTAELAWVRLLRPGFRHCFVAINDGQHWLTLDPLCHQTFVAVQPVAPDFDLAGWYRGRGLIVAETVTRPAPRRPTPWSPFTCVEAVKRVLGIQDRWILTPWQLYRSLTRPASGAAPKSLLRSHRRTPGNVFVPPA